MKDIASRFRRQVALSEYTTLCLGGPARFFFDAENEEDLLAGLSWARDEGVDVRILGGGSNIVAGEGELPALVIRTCQSGFDIDEAGRVSAACGQDWDALVQSTISVGWAGLECLSGIPGLVGATPIQNVGAYGVEVGELLTHVDLIDRQSLEALSLAVGQCELAYRDSIFKREPERYVVTRVHFQLQREVVQPRYRELAQAVEESGEPPSAACVRNQVIELRAKKSMVLSKADPNRRSAGSFFTNVIVDASGRDAVARLALSRGCIADVAGLPTFNMPDGRYKIPAAWLIEQAGLQKGHREGAFGLSSAHTLCVVHHGNGKTGELIAFARGIQERVNDVFGVVLAPEPTFWNCSL